MTAQVGDKLILNDEKFHTVLALDSPIEFSPMLFGMTPQVAAQLVGMVFGVTLRSLRTRLS